LKGHTRCKWDSMSLSRIRSHLLLFTRAVSKQEETFGRHGCSFQNTTTYYRYRLIFVMDCTHASTIFASNKLWLCWRMDREFVPIRIPVQGYLGKSSSRLHEVSLAWILHLSAFKSIVSLTTPLHLRRTLPLLLASCFVRFRPHSCLDESRLLQLLCCSLLLLFVALSPFESLPLICWNRTCQLRLIQRGKVTYRVVLPLSPGQSSK